MVAPNFGQPGGGSQIQVLEELPASSFQPLGATGEVVPGAAPVIEVAPPGGVITEVPPVIEIVIP